MLINGKNNKISIHVSTKLDVSVTSPTFAWVSKLFNRLLQRWQVFFSLILDFVEGSHFVPRHSYKPIGALRQHTSNTTTSRRESFENRMADGQAKYLGTTSAQLKSPQKKHRQDWITSLQLDCRNRRKRGSKPKIFIKSGVQWLSVVLQTSALWSPSASERLCRRHENSQRENWRVEMGNRNVRSCICLQTLVAATFLKKREQRRTVELKI